jgi:hypothetical protein
MPAFAGMTTEGSRSYRRDQTLLAPAVALTLVSHASAQTYPTKPIKAVVGFAAGGPAGSPGSSGNA